MKIAFTGTHSTGKTTILNKIDSKFEKISEYARKLKEEGFPLNKKTTQEGQLILFNKSLNDLFLKKSFICDRCLIDYAVYTLLSEKKIENYVTDYMEGCIQKYMKMYDKVIYFPIIQEISLSQDGIRDSDLKYREKVDFYITSYLKSYKVNFHTLESMTIEDRIEEINTYIGK